MSPARRQLLFFLLPKHPQEGPAGTWGRLVTPPAGSGRDGLGNTCLAEKGIFLPREVEPGF